MKKISTRAKQLYIIIKYYIILVISIFIKVDNNIWLISERGDEARDNGYFFYKYLKQNIKDITVKYVITKNSVDISKIDKKDIVYYQSFKHILYYIKAKYLISTHIQGYSPEFRSFSRLSKYNIFYKKGKEIMLQHGITKSPIDNLYYKNNKKLKMFVCGAKPEYDYIKEEFGYDENVVKYTGFARFDTLITKSNSNKILLMPTWRTYLYGLTAEEFKESEYFKFYNKLINDERIVNTLKKNKLELIFYPHYEMQRYLDTFENKNDIYIKLAHKEDYDVQQLLIECAYLITDYSSVYFDFAYMKKPMVFVQFDKDEYLKKHYRKGYFDYEKDGFGPVFYDYEAAVNEIIMNIKSKFKNDEKYINRSKKFYVYNDKNNCERIYKEILKLK